jgi:lipopolysaccharide transport system permease protein
MAIPEIGNIQSFRSARVIITPPKGWALIDFRAIWAYRELLYFFTWRDIKIRYKQAAFGFAWAVIQPLFMMVIFTLFFGILGNVPSEGVPYPLFTYSALLPWTLFSAGITRSSNSLVLDANLIRKVYFPRVLIPLSSILSPLVDFVIAFIVLFGLMFYYGYFPTLTMLWLPVFLVLQMILALGVGLWLSSINIEYRDVGQAIPFLVQLWLFASPIIYSSSYVPARFRTAYGILNPMSGIIEGFRWSILGTQPPSYNQLIAASAIILVVFISGAFYFHRRERIFADVV